MHGFLLQLQLDGFSFQDCLAVIGVLACKPGLKVPIFSIEKFQDLADHVGGVRINEFRVPVQVESDVFLQADLEGGGLRLL